TGSCPQRSSHGLDRVGMPGDDGHFDESETILPEYLKLSGYSTAIFGKWHLGSKESGYFPHKHGFDLFVGHMDGCIDYFRHTYAGLGNSWFKNGDPLFETGYSTDLITDHSIDYLRNQKESGPPFFLYVAYNAPHYGKTDPSDIPEGTIALRKSKSEVGIEMINSLQAKPEYLERFSKIPDPYRRYYSAMVASMDDNIGRLLKELERTGKIENTIIWFMSDNGGYSKSYFGHASNGKLRGEKATLYDGGIRVPSLLCWKGEIKGNQVITDACCNIDVLPTLAKIIGFESLTAKAPVDGLDISPILFHQGKIDRDFYWEYKPANQFAYRKGDWKIVNNELYNLFNDISESENLAGKYPGKFAELKEAANAFKMRIHPELKSKN
ncbi:MAG TPA: sulfatase-like hydrolase/transferase, partial [Prolixibacteraceae bacterium]|nr:sulfatase-like hydrolase/transferase [Prolixibacteraceae bacterium]